MHIITATAHVCVPVNVCIFLAAVFSGWLDLVVGTWQNSRLEAFGEFNVVGIYEGLDVEVKSNNYGVNLFGICLRFVFDMVRKAGQCLELPILE